jgi:hypothetical protein
MLHPTEKYYPLRPEFAESTFYLYQATKGVLHNDSAKGSIHQLTLCASDFSVIERPLHTPFYFLCLIHVIFSYFRNMGFLLGLFMHVSEKPVKKTVLFIWLKWTVF